MIKRTLEKERNVEDYYDRVVKANSLASQLVGCVDCFNRRQLKDELPILVEIIEPEIKPAVYGFFMKKVMDKKNFLGLKKDPPIQKIFEIFFPEANLRD